MELFRLPLKKLGPHKTYYVRKFPKKNDQMSGVYKNLPDLKENPHLDLDRVNENNENFLELDIKRNSVIR